MAFDPLHELTTAGIDLTFVGAEQREIIGSLSEEEVTLLISIQRQLQENDPEVEAHIVGGLLF
ncbi:aroma-sacti cluster domain-containing protein [Streptosporangium sp. NPDC051022]|uniref:aroma-sacti cluster domain-containing protein n=1 Tax=Streptosporangium sp. NPDC051022 TaxID=3155752 RepID=UPI00341E4EE8